MDEDSDDTGVYLIADGESPDSILIHRQTSQAIFEELKKLLSPLEYDVLKYYLSGLSYQQIASKTKQTKKSIDNALSRIKKKLAAIKEVI